MCIDDKLKEIKPFLVSLRYEGKAPVVDVKFKEGWLVPDSNNVKVEKYQELKNTYMFYSNNENLNMDNVIEYVAKVISMNLEREHKMVLLKAKIKELQEFFVNHSLDELKRMDFTITPLITEMESPVPGNLKDIELPEKEVMEPEEIKEPEVDFPEPQKEEKVEDRLNT